MGKSIISERTHFKINLDWTNRGENQYIMYVQIFYYILQS